ncbi:MULTISPECIES: hypothetical protein [unclassified Bradyrhizobium]
MVGRANFFSIDFDSRSARIADWVLSAASIAYAVWLLWSGDTTYGVVAFAIGLIGCWASWYRPLPRIQRKLRSRFIKRRV